MGRKTKFTIKRRKRDEVSLIKILLVLVVICAAGYGIIRFSQWFTDDYVGGKVEATALTDMDEAQRLYKEGQLVEARELLRPIVARVKNAAIVPKAHLLLADIERAAGNEEALTEHLEAAYSFTNSPEHPTAAAEYAELMEEQGDFDDAVRIYEEIINTAPPSMQGPALNGLARAAMRDGDQKSARSLYQQSLQVSEWESPSWIEAVEAIGEMNTELIFSSRPTPESKAYEVQSGDTLTAIGIKLNTTQGLLIAANDITDPGRLSLGQRLKYTPKDFRIVIDRSRRQLYLLDSEGIFKRYPVGLGRPGHATNLGKFKIGNKQKEPTWYRPGGGVIPPGSPDNELGSRWMPLVPDEPGLPQDLGIHGTNDPPSIGKYSSSGCPRMYEADVQELYDLIVRSTPVFIVEEFNGELAG